MHGTITAAQDAKPLTLTVTGVDWDDLKGSSFYQGELQVQHLLNRIGHELTRQLLAGKVRRPPSLQHAGQRWYRKADSSGHYLTLSGPVSVLRPTYQTSSGGETFCPLEGDCQLAFGAAPPLLAASRRRASAYIHSPNGLPEAGVEWQNRFMNRILIEYYIAIVQSITWIALPSERRTPRHASHAP